MERIDTKTWRRVEIPDCRQVFSDSRSPRQNGRRVVATQGEFLDPKTGKKFIARDANFAKVLSAGLIRR